MIRQTVIPAGNTYLLYIPDEWVGKKVTITCDREWAGPETAPALPKTKPSDLFADCRVDLSKFVFNRDEANDYK